MYYLVMYKGEKVGGYPTMTEAKKASARIKKSKIRTLVLGENPKASERAYIKYPMSEDLRYKKYDMEVCTNR